jgi:hypothetical protein
MTSLLDSASIISLILYTMEHSFLPQHALHPSNNFVAGGVGGLVEIYNTRTDIRFEIALERSASIGDRGEMTSSDEYCSLLLAIMIPFELGDSRTDNYCSFSTEEAKCCCRLLESQLLA